MNINDTRGLYNATTNPNGWALSYLTDNSVSSVAIGTGAKTFTISTGQTITAGDQVIVTYNATNYMIGTVTSYNDLTGALVLSIASVLGSGTYAVWTIQVYNTTLLKINVASASLDITGPSQTTATTIDVTSAITSSSIYVEEFLLVQLSYSDLNLGSTFSDGLYSYTYTITDSSGNEYIKNGSFIHLCNAKCCLDGAMKDFSLSQCDCCDDVDRNKALQLADTLIKGMEEADCGLTVKQITQNLASINRICGNLGGCCN
jgi:hypothetical protein